MAQAGEPVEVTNRGMPFAKLHVTVVPKVDRQRAIEAAHRIREIGAKYKPNARTGGTKLIRKLRDDGE